MRHRKIYLIFRAVISDDGKFYFYDDYQRPESIELNGIPGSKVYLVFYKIYESDVNNKESKNNIKDEKDLSKCNDIDSSAYLNMNIVEPIENTNMKYDQKYNNDNPTSYPCCPIQ
jgi:hypothetical protein